jgi:hypothetical protein
MAIQNKFHMQHKLYTKVYTKIRIILKSNTYNRCYKFQP